MDKKILILQFRTDQSLTHEKAVFRRLIGQDLCEFINVFDKESEVPTFDQIKKRYVGLIVAGSGQFNVTDFSGFIKERSRLVMNIQKKCVRNDFCSLHICFGHQLLALATGGAVQRDPNQAEGGTVAVTQTNEGKTSRIYAQVPESFFVASGHKDSVVTFPQNAKLLASTENNMFASFQYGNNVYSVQFHPELTLDDLLYRFSLYPEYIKGKSTDELRVEHHELPHATKIVKNFVELSVQSKL